MSFPQLCHSRGKLGIQAEAAFARGRPLDLCFRGNDSREMPANFLPAFVETARRRASSGQRRNRAALTM
jgi:hypothetical protein